MSNKQRELHGNTGEPQNQKSRRVIIRPVAIATAIPALFCFLLILRASCQSAETTGKNVMESFPLLATVGSLVLFIIIINFWWHSNDEKKRKNAVNYNEARQKFPLGLLNGLVQPVILFDSTGTVLWGNDVFLEKAPKDIFMLSEKYKFFAMFKPTGFVTDGENEDEDTAVIPDELMQSPRKMLEHLAATKHGLAAYGLNHSPTGEPQSAERDSETVKRIYANDRIGFEGDWVLHVYPYRVYNAAYYMVIMTDVTALNASLQRYDDDTPICAYITLDNLSDLMSRDQGMYRTVSARAAGVIKDWANEYNAVIKEYERDKYIMFFRRERLSEMIESEFSILTSLRSDEVGSEDFSVTASIGISKPEGSLLEKELSAQNALDTALKRGGNQAIVYLNDTEFKPYGAKTEYQPQNHSGVQTRVFAEKLLAVLRKEQYENVIIMGHANPDFDSIGSCVGMARLSMAYGKKTYVAMNSRSMDAISEAIIRLMDVPGYDSLFTDPNQCRELMGPNTVLICCDVNNVRQFEAPDLVPLAETLFIIDHHRKNEFTPVLSSSMEKAGIVKYNFLILPSASSASELVAEILEYALPRNHRLATEEADTMFAGLLLDTKQFTRNTQPATFSAALYLRSCGADPTRAQELFKTELDDYLIESYFGTDVFLERETVAIAREDSYEASGAKRIAAAKTADRLLTVKNVRASFAVARMETDVFISARSDGSVNVQLIMEGLGGGGHYNAAATMLKNTDTHSAIVKLCLEVRRYFGEYDPSQPPPAEMLKEINAAIGANRRNATALPDSKPKKDSAYTPPQKEDAVTSDGKTDPRDVKDGQEDQAKQDT